MKVFFVILTLILTVLAIGKREKLLAVSKTSEIVQTEKQKYNPQQKISLGLHNLMSIVLKNGRSILGTLIGINSKKQTVEIKPHNQGSPRSIQISEIQRIVADRSSPVIQSDGKPPIIRGEDNAVSRQSTWSKIPLNQVLLQQEQINVDLLNVVTPRQLRGIHSVSENSLYVVDEIEFNPSGEINIKVTPIDR
ncbi:hypothetical protein [Anabaena azotica]|uniref:hypothetical protein n=1 Tax=Anabaena azotica TaxID=197653 RepID=UPI0039A5624C